MLIVSDTTPIITLMKMGLPITGTIGLLLNPVINEISGGFRKYSGNEMYCRIMSVVETYKRKGMMVMENI